MRLLKRLYHPVPLTWVASFFGWMGVYAAYAGSMMGAVCGGLAMLTGAVAFFAGRDHSEERGERLRQAVEEAERRNRALGLLRELAGTLLGVETMDQLFAEVTRVARELYAAEGASVLLLAEEGRFLRLVGGVGSFAQRVGALVPIDKSLVGWVATHDEGVLVDDVAADPRAYAALGVPLEDRRMMAAPLRSSGLVLGVLSVSDHRSNSEFTQSDLDLLQTLADQVAVGIDRTRALEESRRNAEALAAKNEELVRATRLKNEFLANMSHELRTPLNAIIGFSDLMLAGGAGPLDEAQLDFLQSISRNGNHLLGLINNVLDLSKIEAGRVSQALQPTDLRQAITAAVTDTASLRAGKQQSCAVDLEDGLLTVQGDSQRIRQILFNLLSNASKFTPERGQIAVSAVRTRAPLPVPAQRAEDGPGVMTREAVWVAVSDDGIGIRPEDMSRLFQEFSQVDASASRRAQGTGLGLALCKKFVELLGGTIGCESIYGKGSTFWFILPVDGPIRRQDVGTRSSDGSGSPPLEKAASAA